MNPFISSKLIHAGTCCYDSSTWLCIVNKCCQLKNIREIEFWKWLKLGLEAHSDSIDKLYCRYDIVCNFDSENYLSKECKKQYHYNTNEMIKGVISSKNNNLFTRVNRANKCCGRQKTFMLMYERFEWN